MPSRLPGGTPRCQRAARCAVEATVVAPCPPCARLWRCFAHATFTTSPELQPAQRVDGRARCGFGLATIAIVAGLPASRTTCPSPMAVRRIAGARQAVADDGAFQCHNRMTGGECGSTSGCTLQSQSSLIRRDDSCPSTSLDYITIVTDDFRPVCQSTTRCSALLGLSLTVEHEDPEGELTTRYRRGGRHGPTPGPVCQAGSGLSPTRARMLPLAVEDRDRVPAAFQAATAAGARVLAAASTGSPTSSTTTGRSPTIGTMS